MSALHVRSLVSVMFVSLLLVDVAAAQTQPYGGGTAVPPMPGNSNGNGTTQPGTLDYGYRPSYYPETFYTDFPMRDVRALPPVVMQSAMARAVHRQSQSTLDLMVLEMKKAFERTREWLAAMNEQREAWAALEAARKEALRSVMEDPAYQASVSLRNSLAEQIEELRNSKYSTMNDVMAMAQVKMGYAATASAMEAAALNASPEVQQARERLRRASAKLSDLRLQFDLSVRNSPEVLAARNTVIDARIRMIGLDALRESLFDVAEFSIAYAYWYNRFNYYQYLNYGVYGYPNYYGYGYPIGWGRY